MFNFLGMLGTWLYCKSSRLHYCPRPPQRVGLTYSPGAAPLPSQFYKVRFGKPVLLLQPAAASSGPTQHRIEYQLLADSVPVVVNLRKQAVEDSSPTAATEHSTKGLEYLLRLKTVDRRHHLIQRDRIDRTLLVSLHHRALQASAAS